MKKLSLIKIPQVIVLTTLFFLIAWGEGRVFNIGISARSASDEISQQRPDTLIEVKKIFPGHSFVANRSTETVLVKNKKGETVAELLFTMPHCKQFTGFAGNVPFIIVVDNNKKIKQLVLLPNNETPNWITGLQNIGFFDTWNNMSLTDAIDKKVDAVTGSTLTSEAVIKSMKHRIAVYTNAVQKKNEVNKKKLLTNIAVVVVLIFALFHFFFASQLRKTRWLLHLLNIGVLGFIALDFVSLAFLHNSLLNGIDIGMRFGLLAIFTFSVLIPLITGKSFYCQYVCPFGSCQYFAGKLTKSKFKYSRSVSQVLTYTKYAYLLVILMMLLAGTRVVIENLEPFMAFAYNFAGVSSFVLAGVFLVLAIFMNKPWCRYFCPTGAVFELMRKPLFLKKHDNNEE